MGSPRRRRHAVVLQTAWVGVAGRSRCTTNCNRSPACHLPGRRVGGPFAVFPGPLRNGVELPCGVDEARSGRRVTRSGGRLAGPVPPASGPESQERSRRNDGTTLASRPVILPTCSVAGQVRPAVTLERSTPRHAACSGAEGRRWSGSGGTTTPRRLVGGHRLPEISRARDNR